MWDMFWCLPSTKMLQPACLQEKLHHLKSDEVQETLVLNTNLKRVNKKINTKPFFPL